MNAAALSSVPVEDVLAWLEAEGSAEEAAGLARFGIPVEGAYGIPMRVLKAKAKALGRNPALASALWESGRYEARILAVFVADPERLSAEEAEAWCRAFDNWAICDTACFHLFDRTPYAWDKVEHWGGDERLYVRRAGFALIWALSVHDKAASDAMFEATFPIMSDGAADDRPHVKKAIDMALRAVGKRNKALNTAARALADTLSRRDEPGAAWIGRNAGRELGNEKVLARL